MRRSLLRSDTCTRKQKGTNKMENLLTGTRFTNTARHRQSFDYPLDRIHWSKNMSFGGPVVGQGFIL